MIASWASLLKNEISNGIGVSFILIIYYNLVPSEQTNQQPTSANEEGTVTPPTRNLDLLEY